jgi:hypothetical protein
MQTWLRKKLDDITAEYLEFGGSGMAFECQFLAYLDCMDAHWEGRHRTDGKSVWARYTEVCHAATDEGEKPTCLSEQMDNPMDLVDALRKLQKEFDQAPIPRPAKAQNGTPARSESKGVMDLFAFLDGEMDP